METMQRLSRKVLVTALISAQVLFPAVSPWAQVPTGPIALSDQPLITTSTVQPNLMYTLDNSGSMDWQFAPMYTANNQSRYCFTDPAYNGLYYNPNFTYLPPITYDGVTRYPASTYTNAWMDGFDIPSGTRNLSTKYPALGDYGDTSLSGSGNRGGYYMYYTAGSPVAGTCYSDSAYTVVNMNSATAAQQQNFANWFSYYRTRMLAMKTSAGEAFRVVDNTFRVGFHTINNPGSGGSVGAFVPVATFSGTQRQNWYSAFYAQQPHDSTPLREAESRIGEYFRAGTSPVGGSVADPVQYSCQSNFHILSTDGQWNASGIGGTVGTTDWDNTLPNNAALLAALGTEFGTTFAAGSPWPLKYRENPSQTSTNTLSDIAAYYWLTDLRPAMVDNVFTNPADPASWQHMVTYGLAFSEQGSIPYPTGLASITSGASVWPYPQADQASAVDDLWHAALIGHGAYFNVKSPQELVDSLGRALADIQSRSSSGSGAELTGNDFTVTGSPVAFRAAFRSGDWSGDVQARTVDPSTGAISLGATWKAQDKLELLVAGSGWNTSRLIATRRTDTGAFVPFRYANLSVTQQASLDLVATTQSKIVDYLRGDRSNEDTASVTNLFRRRLFVLGDIVDSEPRYVAQADEPYADAFNPGYSTFKSTTAARTPMVYVGANDGMLHAIKATVGDTDSGYEKWAYVPGMSYIAGADGLGSLTWRPSDPLPEKFSHRYRVDQTPTVDDVDFGRTGGTVGAVDWRTLLVAGMNKGGKGYYAIDVTNPAAATETAVASKVLWEFTGEIANDPKMGYSFGEPLVFKTRRFGWVVAVSSGYNNAAGTGHVWLLNPKTGAVLQRFDTGAGSAAIPSGLAYMNVFMQSAKDSTAEQLYATDLMGNVWRFDVSSASAAGWSSSGVKVASVGQPITSAPAVALNPLNLSERWVFFGSGRMLSTGDLVGGATTTFYAIKDGNAGTPGTFASPLAKSDLVAITPSTEAPTGPTVKGWYMDMTSGGGGQIVNTPFVSRGVVIWATSIPTTDPCSPGATSVLYARSLGTGRNKLTTGTFATLPANVNKVQTVKTTVAAGTATTSQGRFVAVVSTANGDQTIGVDLTHPLIGGRTGVRFVAAQ